MKKATYTQFGVVAGPRGRLSDLDAAQVTVCLLRPVSRQRRDCFRLAVRSAAAAWLAAQFQQWRAASQGRGRAGLSGGWGFQLDAVEAQKVRVVGHDCAAVLNSEGG